MPQYNKRILPVIKAIIQMSYEENVPKSDRNHIKKHLNLIQIK